MQAHKHVFRARSEVFSSLVDDMEKKKGEASKKLMIQNLRLPTFCAMLMFMYTDAIPRELLGTGNMNVSVAWFEMHMS